MIVSINGEVMDPEEAKIPVMDRGFLFGDSIYETLITFDKKLFRLDKHLERLKNSARLLNMDITVSEKDIVNYLQKTVEASSAQNLKVRLVVTRGTGVLSLDPTGDYQNNIVVIAIPRAENPPEWYTEGVKAVIADIMRTSPKSVDPNAKSGNYLNNVMAYRQAREAGAFEAIMLNQKGHVTEATTSNIWVIKNGKIMTPPIESGLLQGITRTMLLASAKKKGYDISEQTLASEDIFDADEMFLTSTSRYIVPVVQVDGKSIGSGKPGKLTLELLELFHEEVRDFTNSTDSD
jgi:branched-chain amino acid aminotransferase